LIAGNKEHGRGRLYQAHREFVQSPVRGIWGKIVKHPAAGRSATDIDSDLLSIIVEHYFFPVILFLGETGMIISSHQNHEN